MWGELEGAPPVVGLYEGNTCSNHLKVMAHTKVGQVPCWEVEGVNCKLCLTCNDASR